MPLGRKKMRSMSKISVREMRVDDLEQVNALRTDIQRLHHDGKPDLFGAWRG